MRIKHSLINEFCCIGRDAYYYDGKMESLLQYTIGRVDNILEFKLVIFKNRIFSFLNIITGDTK